MASVTPRTRTLTFAGALVLTGTAYGAAAAPAHAASAHPAIMHTATSNTCTNYPRLWLWHGSPSYIKTAQKKLGGLTVDGSFGPLTQKKTISFQKSHKLVGDGIIGPLTWTALCGTASTPAPKTVTRYVVPGIDYLAVRTGPSTTHTMVAKLTSGTKVTGTVSGHWMHLTAGTYKGKYVSADWLTTTPPSTPKPPPSNKTVTGYVMADAAAAGSKANIRSAPSFSAKIVGTYGPHAKVTGTISGNWLHTSKGYVNRGTIETSTSNPSSINGKIPSSQLCKVNKAYNSPGSFAPGYTKNTQRYLNCYALPQLNAMEKAYKAHFGRYARIDLTYRSIDEQWYWYNKFGSPRAAYPGTSNHGYGLAIDFRETDAPGEEFGWGGTGQKWLEANFTKYGFVNPFPYGTDGESYHFQFIG